MGRSCCYRPAKGEQAMRVRSSMPEGTRLFPNIVVIQANGGPVNQIVDH